MIESDTDTTASRYAELRRYMDAEVTDGNRFVCSSEGPCRVSLRDGVRFARGQLSYVGPHYDLTIGGRPFRILVIGMETGREDEFVTLDVRREQIFGRVRETFGKRNAHMKGTTSALRVLFGQMPGEDEDGEFIMTANAGPVHLLEAYSMANLRLCSAVRPGSTESKASSTMSRACLRHLEKTIQILAPTVVVLQGKSLRQIISSIVAIDRAFFPELERVHLAGVPVVLASFTHPAAKNRDQNWGRLKRETTPYLWDTVTTRLEKARSVALGFGSP